MKENVLITGAAGMLGGYVREEFLRAGADVCSLGRGPENDFRCDLMREVPGFGGRRFDVVVHCAGTEDDSLAALNTEGTRRLLESLEGREPRNLVYVSSARVYDDVSSKPALENFPAGGRGAAGRCKAQAEAMVSRWASERGVTLTVVRPTRMFGSRVGGETLRLFNDAVGGAFIHIRENDARVSIVTAFDVAKGIAAVYGKGGVYNASDGRFPRFVEMMEAMTANAGRMKRAVVLPVAWAEWAWRLGRRIPVIDRNLSPAVAAERMKNELVDGSLLAETAGFDYYDTIKVIMRTDPEYPYES